MRDTTKGSKTVAMTGGEAGRQTFGILAPIRRRRRTTTRGSVTASCTAGIIAKVSRTVTAMATTVAKGSHPNQVRSLLYIDPGSSRCELRQQLEPRAAAELEAFAIV